MNIHEAIMLARDIDVTTTRVLDALVDYVVEKPMGLSSLQIDDAEIAKEKQRIYNQWDGLQRFISDVLWQYLNGYEQNFVSFLETIEFSMGYDNGGFYLHDLQGANLGNIESERFADAMQIFERLDSYINDYIHKDLLECAEELNLDACEKVNTLSDWLQYRDDMPNNSFEFECIDMICNHPNDIDLHKVNTYLSSL